MSGAMVLNVSLVALVFWLWIDVLLPPSQVTWCQTGPGVCSCPRSGCKAGHGLEGVAPEYAAKPRAVTPWVDCCSRCGTSCQKTHRRDQTGDVLPWIRYTSRWRSFRAAKQLENKRQAVNAAMEQLRKAEAHLHELQEKQHQLSALTSEERGIPCLGGTTMFLYTRPGLVGGKLESGTLETVCRSGSRSRATRLSRWR